MNSVPEELKPYVFKPGQSGNPSGRPKGSVSIKQRVQEYIDTHPEAVTAMVGHFVHKNRELTWQMLEGRPTDNSKSEGNTSITLNVMTFHGDNYSPQLESREAPATYPEQPIEVQGDSLAS